MPIPQNKSELLQAINVSFEKLLKDLKLVPSDISHLPKM